MLKDSKINAFRIEFFRWADHGGLSGASRKSLSSALRIAIEKLRLADECLLLSTRSVDLVESVPAFINARHVRAFPNEERYCVTVLQPDWRRIRINGKDEGVNDAVEGFFHLADQYVARSQQLRATAALALTHGVAPNFRLGNAEWLRVEGMRSLAEVLDKQPYSTASKSRKGRLLMSGSRERHAWAETLNTLDPHVHRACFQYWRARALSNADFWEEALVALDCLAAVVGEAVQRWRGLAKAPDRRELAVHLGMSPDDGASMEFAYELRCSFGAHAAHAKWWDFSEVYEAEIDESWQWSKRLLHALNTFERVNRRVDPDPAVWSEWFELNADWLFDAVWFNRVPKQMA